MSLRVLLADESDTIKKVFQLALQDMNAEIKSVQSGLDVINVAQSFHPQIIFADVLLQKKNGYDTCLEIKQNSSVSQIPVILMWSSFMELDQEQYKKSKANDQLEKPFDADFLRDLVKKYVPAAAANPLSQFLTFPKSISQDSQPTKSKTAPKVTSLPEEPMKEDTSEFNLNAILGDLAPKIPENIDNLFDNLTSTSFKPQFSQPAISSDVDLNQFKIDTPNDNLDQFEALNLGQKSADHDEPTSDILVPREEFAMTDLDHIQPTQLENVFNPHNVQPLESTQQNKTVNLSTTTENHRTTTKTAPSKISTPGLNDQEIEAIVRAHTEEFIKTQLQHSLMSIVEKIVREELNKVLEEEVRLKQELHDDNR